MGVIRCCLVQGQKSMHSLVQLTKIYKMSLCFPSWKMESFLSYALKKAQFAHSFQCYGAYIVRLEYILKQFCICHRKTQFDIGKIHLYRYIQIRFLLLFVSTRAWLCSHKRCAKKHAIKHRCIKNKKTNFSLFAHDNFQKPKMQIFFSLDGYKVYYCHKKKKNIF